MEYSSITDVRNHIDQIDSELVKLIAQRDQCVKAAAAFKTDQASVRTSDFLYVSGKGRRNMSGGFQD